MKCLIINDMHPSIHDMMEELSIEVDYQPDISLDEVKDCIHNYEGLLVRGKKIQKDILERAKKLQFIGRAGAGLDNIDLDVAKNMGIALFNAPEGNRDAVAEHTIGLILGLLNKLRAADTEVRSGIWDREGNRGYELGGKTVSIIGYGNMGGAFAKRLIGFNCNVLAYDKYKKDITDKWVKEVDLETIFQETDILSLHLPLTKETAGMFNIEFWSKFKKPIYVLNTARGEVLLLKDLLQALDKGLVLGAGLDVLENEKLNKLNDEQKDIFEKITHHEKLFLSPHVAGWSYESHIRINRVLADKIKAYIKDDVYESVI